MNSVELHPATRHVIMSAWAFGQEPRWLYKAQGADPIQTAK